MNSEHGRPRTGLTAVATVFVPVRSQDRSLAFYCEVLGFEQLNDFTYGGAHRWVEVAPPGGGIALALVPTSEGTSAGGDVTRCALTCADVDRERLRLERAGVVVDRAVARTGVARGGLVSREVRVADPVPAQFHLSDPDGNRFLVVEAT